MLLSKGALTIAFDGARRALSMFPASPRARATPRRLGSRSTLLSQVVHDGIYQRTLLFIPSVRIFNLLLQRYTAENNEYDEEGY
jgi:hypothetical protein